MNTELKSQIIDYSQKNKYVAEQFASAKCRRCQCDTFTIVMNENEGVAARICTSCDSEHSIADSTDSIHDVEEVYPIECTCGENEFKVLAGVALFKGKEDVRWFYLGCECTACGLSGVYGDWKSESGEYRKLLNNI